MNFYAASNMPVYRVERETRQKSSKQGSKTSRILGIPSPQRDTAPPPVRPVTSSDVVPHNSLSIDQFLDPAVDGPPSPETLRELSQQMKRASVRDKHQSHQTSSSGSSSLRSLTSADRPSWENPLDGKTLSRKSSGRSTSSSMPSRERPESVQIFGKTLFNRRPKGRRESSAQSSSSSMYSTDAVGDSALPPAQTSSRDSTIPGLFGLRRSIKPDQAAETQRRPTISGPYNFQHVAHTQKEHALDSQHGSLEQLNLHTPPPRPPRSPVDQFAPNGVHAPPRGPSRVLGGRHERFDSIDGPYADPGSPPSTSYGYTPDMDIIHEHAYSASMSPHDDANWPLPCPSSTASEYTLPNVPEEDENAVTTKKSRASVASNSSLRGSQSVPMLRGLASRQKDDSDRRPSDASDTLGRFDMVAAQLALREALGENGDALPREAWEDDIDYCYDHEAEADCDYEWSRPSLETCRDGDTATPVDDHGRGVESRGASPALLMPGQFDVPALSPVSQLSLATPQEAITPTVMNNPKASNFSLPRIDSKNLLHVRKPSDASSFKESHGFTLSPSLLIPMDYQQQMLACEAERQEEASDFAFRPFDEPELNMDPSALLLRYRTSASTTGTIESNSSAFDKHNSTASTSTDYTRLTASVSSLDMEPCLPTSEPLQRFPSFESHSRGESKAVMPTLPESEEAAQPSTRRPHFKSRGSESNLVRMAMDEPWPGKNKPTISARRGRARTTSLSTPPPANQYALFPQVQLSGNRI
ncbi:hypothetical protein CHGG_02862 [Chaetomium globosum CBS 148.51]|uniref:CRIB domain-containing protein n=1 Tax=Chaetomium globosum (strain ATCC 6205 / CBS 148.51 / DSM 1962 / NBRC 6347 / NRRL 1970) TaxID=306901 RepID=Q2HA92_CHAGB|nr:uncharacterized protein CHGG_02862 [Chaetomium globosum CBS 148.51]EAQ90927.1 hypothetical protein CHGG_02862 [Chaetomium globosum CBS 148.51]